MRCRQCPPRPGVPRGAMERAAVLRVQRKRGGAEPAEALLLACKRLRAEPGQGAPVERGVFKLVATVSSKVPPGSSGRRRPRGWVRVGRPAGWGWCWWCWCWCW